MKIISRLVYYLTECELCIQEEAKEEESLELEHEEDGKKDESEPPTQLESQCPKSEVEADVKGHTHATPLGGVEVKGSGVTHTPVVTEEHQPSPLPSPSKLSSGHQEAEHGDTEGVCLCVYVWVYGNCS